MPPHVGLEQSQRNLTEGASRGGDLLEDVRAVAPLVDHASDAPHLTFDTPQPAIEPQDVRLARGEAHARVIGVPVHVYGIARACEGPVKPDTQAVVSREGPSANHGGWVSESDR